MTNKTIPVPKGWEINLLKCLCSIKTGDKDVNQGNENGIYPFFTCAQEISNSDTFSFEGEAILIAGNGNFNVKFYSGKFEAYQRTYVLQSFKNVNGKYLFYFIKNKLNDITKGNRGSTIKYIRLGDIADYPIIYPTNKATQQAIVNKIESLFAEIDAGIGHLKIAEQQLKQYRQALLKNAFNGELTKQWRTEHAESLPTATELLEHIQTAREQHHAQQLVDWQSAVKNWEENGKQGKKPSKPKTLRKITADIADDELTIPKENWVIGLFGDLVEIKSNLVQPEQYLDFPHIAPDNIEKETGKLLPFKTIRDDGVISPKHYFYAGQIIYSKIRPNLSKLTLVDFDGLCSADMYPLESDVFDHHFLKHMMLSRYFVKRASTAGSRSVLPKINQSELSMIPLPLCSLAEQAQIVAILESKLTACDQLANEITAQLKQAELLKQAVLKAAFSGKLLEPSE
ncbi:MULTISPECIES: restriction endonuclease subunit S [Gallibacterium]|uniref:restriction endonuclease subunit S n=1 Tax=Gallibacterium TaxID=155493 RepID=UPI00068B8E14|nr:MULTISPECIES: restriction endonuclease subunit S [Gallibacterium]